MHSQRPSPHLPHQPPSPLPAPPVTVRLQTVALVRDRSLVSADIRWRWPQQATVIATAVAAAVAATTVHATSSAWQRSGGHCLVTWDVLGGGLMGNLLTDVPEVQLSLWQQTVYHIQVTCKCKVGAIHGYVVFVGQLEINVHVFLFAISRRTDRCSNRCH